MLDALDDVRRALIRDPAGGAEAKAVKNARFLLLNNPWRLGPEQNQGIAEFQKLHRPL